MLDVVDELEIRKFSKKDLKKKNVKVRHGEYQYVSTPTLTMFEFDPACLTFIHSRILSIDSMHKPCCSKVHFEK